MKLATRGALGGQTTASRYQARPSHIKKRQGDPIYLRPLLIALLLGSPAWAAEPKNIFEAEQPVIDLPEKVTGPRGDFITIVAKTNGKEVRWIAKTPGLNVFPSELLRDSRTAVVTATVDGTYELIGYTALGDVPSLPDIVLVVVGTPGPVPPPGPGPQPPPGPGPGPTPVPSGKLSLMIIHESADSTPAWAMALNDLTDLSRGEAAKYLKSKGHFVYKLDDDSKDASDQDALKKWRPHFEKLTLPALLVIDQASNLLLKSYELPKSGDADEKVVEYAKANGG